MIFLSLYLFLYLFFTTVNGNYTEWGEFSRCVPNCGNGTQIRQRTCTNPRPAHGGKSCLEQGLGDDSEERPCSNGPCPRKCLIILLQYNQAQ